MTKAQKQSRRLSAAELHYKTSHELTQLAHQYLQEMEAAQWPEDRQDTARDLAAVTLELMERAKHNTY